MSGVLVIAVHPDDEILGCGGTLMKHRSIGADIHWCLCTSMRTEYGYDEEDVRQKEASIGTVAERLGVASVHRLDLCPVKVDDVPFHELITKLKSVIDSVQPETVYLPFKHDVHSDHRIIYRAAMSTLKTFRCKSVKKIYMMETISETEFNTEETFAPNYFVDISEHFHAKKELIQCYPNELGEHPFPRSLRNIEALAVFRGAMAGCEYAESFMVVKDLWV